IHVGAVLEQRLRRLRLMPEDREVERREAVGREGARLRRVVGEERAQPLDAAERRGLEHVELVVGCEQRPGAFDVAAIQRLQSLAHEHASVSLVRGTTTGRDSWPERTVTPAPQAITLSVWIR